MYLLIELQKQIFIMNLGTSNSAIGSFVYHESQSLVPGQDESPWPCVCLRGDSVGPAGQQGNTSFSIDSYYLKTCNNMAKNVCKFTYGTFLEVY